jgi:hypothetical protein
MSLMRTIEIANQVVINYAIDSRSVKDENNLQSTIDTAVFGSRLMRLKGDRPLQPVTV